MKPISLTDLDGVHFQLRRDCPVDAELTAAAVNSALEPTSFMTPKQAVFLDWLLSQSEVVPVTARPVESFKRVLISFTGHAICSFGGVILTPAGLADPRWHEQMQRHSAACSAQLSTLKKQIESGFTSRGITCGVTLIRDDDCDLYLNCTETDGIARDLSPAQTLVQSLLPEGWRLHVSRSNIAVLPPFLGKERAVSFYLSELAPPASCLLGIGDSLSDLEFMALCDYAVTPTRSQIHVLLNRLHQLPGASA